MQPGWATFVPRETTGQGAERVDIPLQIRKGILSRRIVQTLFAGLTGGAEREDGSLDGFAATQAVLPADLEKANIALAAVEVPFKGRGHGGDARGLQDIGFFGKRIGEPRLLDVWRTEQSIAIFGNVGNGENFTIAETDEAFPEARFGFIVREAGSALASHGQARREFVEAVDSGHFLDEINFALDFGAPGGLRAFPGGEERTFGAAILVDTHGSKTEGAESCFDFLVGDVGAHNAEKFGAREKNFPGCALAGIDVDDTGKKFASSELQNELGATPRSKLGHFRIGAAAKARGGFGVKLQVARGAANGDRIKPGALDQDVFRREGNFCFGAAHDAANTHGARAVAIADHADVGVEGAFDAVERPNFL